MSISIEPFVPQFDQSLHDDLKARLALTRLPEAETVDDWEQGIPLAYVKELLAYWQQDYDWLRCEERLNRWPHFRARIDGLPIHFIHVRSERADAKPLIMTHGWPGSVLEFMDIIEPLTAPADPAQPAFHLILPSLPGYAFSGKPTQPGWSVEKTAEAWDALMRALGYDRYFAQGGDWGAAVTIAIGSQNKGACAAIHVNMPVARPPEEVLANPTAYEAEALARMGWYRSKDNGYAIIQATRPQTLGYGLTDSPVGQMAWIIEKFQGWSDCDGDPETIFSKDQLLDNVMLYWLTASAASSARLYWQSFLSLEMPPIRIPSGCSLFPKELFRPSRRWAETRFKNITYWNELDKGGHFAAMEQPELFASELRNCFGAMSL
jgi:pimeloyl-ACP methyl ester carboxylesterase